MKKEKKEKKEKELKKETKKTNNIIISKNMKKTAKYLGMITVFLATIVGIFVFVFSIITALKVSNTTKVELLHDNFSVTFISNLKGISIDETEYIIEGYGSKTLFIVYDIVIPAIATIFAMILIIILVKKILDFINSINKEKDLFSKDKIIVVEKLSCITVSILTIFLIIYNRTSSLLFYVFTCALVFIVIGLFKKCVEYKNNQ